MVLYVSNGEIKVRFWKAIPLILQKVTIHLQLLECDTRAIAGILFEKDMFS